MLLYMLWMLAIEAAQIRSAERINASVITAGDFSVWVTGVRGSDGTNGKLEEYARHYGHVVSACHLLEVGRTLTVTSEVRTHARALPQPGWAQLVSPSPLLCFAMVPHGRPDLDQHVCPSAPSNELTASCCAHQRHVRAAVASTARCGRAAPPGPGPSPPIACVPVAWPRGTLPDWVWQHDVAVALAVQAQHVRVPVTCGSKGGSRQGHHQPQL